jgi:hypothetical protein
LFPVLFWADEKEASEVQQKNSQTTKRNLKKDHWPFLCFYVVAAAPNFYGILLKDRRQIRITSVIRWPNAISGMRSYVSLIDILFLWNFWLVCFWRERPQVGD